MNNMLEKPAIHISFTDYKKQGYHLKLFSILLFLSVSWAAYGQNIDFKASTKQKVVVGEQFQLNYSINSKSDNFSGPAIRDFTIITGPNTSSSSSVQIINGNVTQKVSYNFIYILQATKEGTFTIGPARAIVDGKSIQSNSLTITVVKGSSQSSGNQGNQNNRQSDNSSGDIDDGTDVFIKAIPSQRNPYQGEQVIVTFKIFTKIPVSQYSVKKQSSFQGFWTKDLMGQNDKPKQERQVINGEEYVVADIQKIALFPQRSGDLTIDPMELEIVAQVRKKNSRKQSDPFFDFFNDPFFSGSYQNVKKVLKSNPVTISVKQLPANGKPASFNGAVGSFTMNSTIDRTEVKANDAITLKYTIQGSGNLELIDKLNIEFPPDFEVYDPKITNNIQTGNNGISGSRSFEYVIIPRNAGNFSIKPVEFSYYDANKNNYITISSPEYSLKIAKGEGNQAAISYSGVNQEDIKYIGKDILHIRSTPFGLSKTGSYFFGSMSYFLFLLIPLLLFVVMVFLLKKEIQRRSNAALMKNRKATKISRRRLKLASQFLKTNDEKSFFEEISKALWGYLSDKFTIPPAELSRENIKSILLKRNVAENTIDQFIAVIDECEYARFAPGNKSQQMDTVYTRASEIIQKIETELR